MHNSRFFFILMSVFTMTLLSLSPFAHAETNVHNLEFKTLNTGELIPLADYKGKVLLVVNTASKCGFTDQYKGLEQLYQTYKDQGLVVIGVPSGDFADQEFDDSAEIKKFCELNYGVTFPLTAKQHVKGDAAHPFFKAAKERFGFMGVPKWNFQKYIVAKDGTLVKYYLSSTKPTSRKIKKALEKELKKD